MSCSWYDNGYRSIGTLCTAFEVQVASTPTSKWAHNLVRLCTVSMALANKSFHIGDAATKSLPRARQIIGPDRSQMFDVGVNFLSLRHQCENPLLYHHTPTDATSGATFETNTIAWSPCCDHACFDKPHYISTLFQTQFDSLSICYALFLCQTTYFNTLFVHFWVVFSGINCIRFYWHEQAEQEVGNWGLARVHVSACALLYVGEPWMFVV